MKKIYVIFIFVFMSLFLASCKGSEVEPNEGEILFDFPEEYLQYLPYDEVPNFSLKFEGTINTVVRVSLSNKRYFSKNDDYNLSEVIKDLLEEYEAKDRLSIRVFSKEEQFETRMNKLILDKKGELKHDSQIMKVKDGEVFNEIAYLNLENGLTLTIEYRRFVSDFEGEFKTYYAWRYTSPLNMVLHYPIMIHKNAMDENEFLIVPLPTKVIYHLGISRQLPLDRLINKDEYFRENFRRFHYPNFSTDVRENQEFDLEADIRFVKDYYIRDFNGREEEENFNFSYLGYDFKITFEEETFLIDIID